ncbi:aldehyde dehydrogenase [Terricaulis sp.]|uniref:aldehyde dehydrogenase n=1 Tax=Terricaulis sp. TaxID=2768686 RepID=UPI003783A8B9
MTLQKNIDRASSIKLPTEAVIGGKLVAAKSGKTFANVGPRDGKTLNLVAEGDAADIDAAVAAARASFEDKRWRSKTPREKKRIMFKLAELMERDLEELAMLETLDMGKPISDTRAIDIPTAINSIRWYAEALDKVYGEVATTPSERLSFIVREPLGVVGAIVPWNFPLHMACWKVAPALAAGNSIVLKPAEQSPSTALKLGALALEAGVPDGVLNVVPGYGEGAGQALARHMDVDLIAFTGSGEVGRKLMAYSGESNLKRVALELGGKSPQIVFADAENLDAAAEAAAWGIFFNQGEICNAASRLLVEEKIKDEFLAKVVEKSAKYMPGDPLDPGSVAGAIVSEAQMKRVLGYVEKAKAEGATLAKGGNRIRTESGGYYIEPTVFDKVANTHTLAREEVFGPVLGVITFKAEEEAVRLANDTVYGLASGLWTANISRAHRVARELRTGLVWINGWDACDITVPFGGAKQSGFGRDRSLHALEKYTELKGISITYG